MIQRFLLGVGAFVVVIVAAPVVLSAVLGALAGLTGTETLHLIPRLPRMGAVLAFLSAVYFWAGLHD